MIEIETCQLAEHHLLHAFPTGKISTPLPSIIFYHGFTSSALVYSYFAVALAQAGFRVIMPDAAEHGARFSGNAPLRMTRFWQILQQNMQEFTALRAAILQENWLQDDRLAVAGASMGGMTALGIMTQHPEVSCVASLMGSGYFTRLAKTLFPLRRWIRQRSRRRSTALSRHWRSGMSRNSWNRCPTGRCCYGMEWRMMSCQQKNRFACSGRWRRLDETGI